MPRRDDRCNLTPLEESVLRALERKSNAWPSLDRLTRDVGLDPTTSHDTTRVLCALSYFRRRKWVSSWRPSPGDRSRYALTTLGQQKLAGIDQQELFA
jgi:hypothetical protein